MERIFRLLTLFCAVLSFIIVCLVIASLVYAHDASLASTAVLASGLVSLVFVLIAWLSLGIRRSVFRLSLISRRSLNEGDEPMELKQAVSSLHGLLSFAFLALGLFLIGIFSGIVSRISEGHAVFG